MFERELLKKTAKKHDLNWKKVIALAKENGFIIQNCEDTVVLIKNEEQIKNYGYEVYEEIQRNNDALD